MGVASLHRHLSAASLRRGLAAGEKNTPRLERQKAQSQMGSSEGFDEVLFSILAVDEQIPLLNLRTLVPCSRGSGSLKRYRAGMVTTG